MVSAPSTATKQAAPSVKGADTSALTVRTIRPAHGLCKFCHGYGNCMTVQNGRYEWRTCPFCQGHGTRNAQRGPATISTDN